VALGFTFAIPGEWSANRKLSVVCSQKLPKDESPRLRHFIGQI